MKPILNPILNPKSSSICVKSGKSKGTRAAQNLHYAKLIGVNLSGADLNYAILSGADLSGADLSGADLSGTKGLD